MLQIISKHVPDRKCAYDYARPKGGWTMMTSVDGCRALASYLVSNPTLPICRLGDDLNIIIIILITSKPFQSSWLRIWKNFKVKHS